MPGLDVDDSSEFRLFETQEFLGKLRKLDAPETRFLRRKLEAYVYPQLRANPFLGPNIRKLKGYDPETWRYRIGRFRVFFLVDPIEKVVFLLSVDDRKDAYR